MPLKFLQQIYQIQLISKVKVMSHGRNYLLILIQMLKFTVIGGFQRTERNDKEEKNEEKDQQGDIIQNKKIISKIGQGEKTLEKNIQNINVNKYDLEFDVDPLFSKTSSKFDNQTIRD
ncbi:hypothetical protein IMG5_070470 [Ichthyophthirius multifiliis]|uniref:Condensin complex subunit 2 n=1 Tax=Ichthyophthirius multifiliis TaxID=5932 RepID=G0QPR0_ICHMU|nr:hypothetical protein IMG5_070470 [Ichthyophthirius multifiliis]EGR32775.1 hypothetical protein IMG5_070470 [Ichthyophthirius multifiliis]|eukprot:XP_004036761.1 hypothetical protein IMG5_070470 [Ichthyophthirius multifiliis]